jgi:predicted NAD/FAD-binding protein
METSLRKKIAIIGTGISGLGAASLLHPHHDITVYEKNAYIGGHSRTVEVETPEGMVPVDTGFIVFNRRNYPLLTKLFEHLKVPVTKSDMSFGASIQNSWLEFGTQRMLGIFAQKRNLLRPAFWGMLLDILRFNKNAKRYLERDASITLGQCLDELKMGRWFRHYFLLPMGACIWSTPLSQMLAFPAQSFIRFFDNHGLLTIRNQSQWYTVVGGSKEYVGYLTLPFKSCIRLNTSINSVKRVECGIRVIDSHGHVEQFDEVVFACHADQALRMLEKPTPEELNVLGSFRYQNNRMVLHSDLSFMPKKKAAWASWVYLSETREDKSHAVSLSYWMNLLQPLSTQTPMIVTLNPAREPESALVHDEYLFEHPVFDEAAIRAQAKIKIIQGQDGVWYCGAYQRYGFHEDGLGSAVNMVRQMGIEPPWI